MKAKATDAAAFSFSHKELAVLLTLLQMAAQSTDPNHVFTLSTAELAALLTLSQSSLAVFLILSQIPLQFTLWNRLLILLKAPVATVLPMLKRSLAVLLMPSHMPFQLTFLRMVLMELKAAFTPPIKPPLLKPSINELLIVSKEVCAQFPNFLNAFPTLFTAFVAALLNLLNVPAPKILSTFAATPEKSSCAMLCFKEPNAAEIPPNMPPFFMPSPNADFIFPKASPAHAPTFLKASPMPLIF